MKGNHAQYSQPQPPSDDSQGSVEKSLRRKLETGLTEVDTTAGAMFGDAADEFATLEAILGAMTKWRHEARSAYDMAYIPLNAPALLACHVRL